MAAQVRTTDGRQPSPRLRRLLSTVVVGLGLLAVAAATWVGIDRHYYELLSPTGALVQQVREDTTRLRSLSFRRAVVVQVRTGDAFTRPVISQISQDDLAGEQTLERALGLIPPDQELRAARIDLVAAGYGAYYQPGTDAVTVQAVKRSPVTLATLAHEMTHALQDQHFDLTRMERASRDAELAVAGLVEGDAELVERRYFEGRSWIARAATIGWGAVVFGSPPPEGLAALIALSGLPGVPADQYRQFMFGYLVGPAFVQALLDAGGQSRLDAAFAAPPTTTEHILHPARYLAGEGPVAVAEPTADGPVAGRGVLGELRLALLLADRLGLAEARWAADGWGGDRYVAWQQEGTSCARVSIAMDTERDRRELVDALRRHGAGLPGAGSAIREDGSTTTATWCR